MIDFVHALAKTFSLLNFAFKLTQCILIYLISTEEQFWRWVTTPPPAAGNRSLKAKLASETSPPTLNPVWAQSRWCFFDGALGGNGNAHAYKCWCCGHGRLIKVPHLYLRGHSKFAKSQPQLLLPSALPQTLNLFAMDCSILWALSGVLVWALLPKQYALYTSNLQSRESRDGLPALQISDKSIKICTHCTYRMKTKFFWQNI